MPMPPATVYKDHSVVLTQDQIGRAGQIFLVKPESKAEREKAFTNQNFRPRVLASNAGHAEASLLRSEYVRH